MELEQTWEALHVLGNRVNGLSGALDAYLNRTAYFSALENRTALNDRVEIFVLKFVAPFVPPNMKYSPFKGLKPGETYLLSDGICEPLP
jgi:hypothetical protein